MRAGVCIRARCVDLILPHRYVLWMFLSLYLTKLVFILPRGGSSVSLFAAVPPGDL